MAKTKVTGGYIADSAITSDHLHTTLDLSTKTLTIGATTVSGHLIPDTNITYDLGSSTYRFRDIYLDGTTINLGGTELKKNSDGDIEFKSGSNFKRLVVSELEFDDGTNRKKFKISSGRIKSFDSSGVSDTADKISLSSNTTDDLGEGSSNLYFTTARARSSFSASTGIAITDGAISAAAVPNSSLTNSSVTINSNSLSLGGTLTLDTDDIGEGSTNLYYTTARWDTKMAAADTDDLSEGSTNLYYTTARWDTKMAAADTDDLSEGSTNLYFTNARARGAISVSGNALSYNSSTGVLTANYEESPSFTGNVTISGYVSSAGAYFSDTLRVLNSAGDGWNNWATRSAGNFNLSVGTINSGSITVDPSGSYGNGITINAGDNLDGTYGAKQILMTWGGSTTIDYAHSIRTRHNSNADTGNTVEVYLWDYGTDSSTTIGTKRALVLENSTGLDLLTGGYKVGGTTVINSSRNLTNIGTINSGQLNVNVGTANTIAVFESTDDKGFIQIKDNDTNAHLIAKDGNFSIADDSGTFDTFRIDLDTGNVDISGTFDSGAITSTSSITGTSLDINGNAAVSGYLNFDGSDQSGLLRIGGSNVIGKSNNFLYIDPNNSFSSGIYINNQLKVDGGLISSYNEDLQLRAAGTTVLTLATADSSATFAGTVEATSFSDGTISGITFIDEDSFATNSATRVPTQQSIKAYVDAQVAGVVDSAPAALNTLNELAAALGDDANFSTTTSTALGNRLRVDTASQGLTGTQQANAITNLGITATKAELNYVDGVTSNIQTQLDGKQASGSYLTGNQTITLSGDVSGSGTTSIAVTVNDDSHFHHRLDSTDDRDMKPNTSGIATSVQAIKPFFSSYGGMTGSANGTFVDVLALDTYSDSSGGGPSAITFKKGNASGNPEMHIWKAAWNATTWGTGQRVFADNYHPNADTWTTARTITLGGDLSGSVSINGSANVTLTATVADDSHNHVISNVDGLQTALDAKAPLASPSFTTKITTPQIHHTGVIQVLNGTAAQGMKVGSLYAGTSYNNSAPSGMVNALNGFQVGNTTVIDSSRNLTNIGTISSGNVNSTGQLQGTTVRIQNTSNSTKYGLSLYGSSPTNPTYGIMFTGTSGSGTHGSVTADWATYFTMNNTSGRGWIFRDNITPTNVASISNTGNATFNGTVTASGGNSGNWNTAYGWGNHASAGYQPASTAITTSSTQPNNIYIRGASPTIYLRDTDHISSMIHQNSNLFYILRADAADDTGWTTYSSSSASSWPMIINLTNSSPSVSFGPANITANGNTVWTAGNDSSGSGLDADLLDGQHGSYYYAASNPSGYTTFANGSSEHITYVYRIHSSDSTSPDNFGYSNRYQTFNYGVSSGVTGPLISFGGLGSNYPMQLTGAYSSGGGTFKMRTRNGDSSSWNAWRTIWHDGNDGSGSGLDADLLDGIESSQFLRSDASDVMSGELNVSRNGGATGSSAPSYSQANIELQTSSNHVPAISFHRGAYSATTLYEYDGELYVNPWITRAQAGKLISSGNYDDYVTTSYVNGLGVNATTLDSLDLHTGRNNEVNKVVRTDANGYIQAGWINTTSGDRGTTAPDRIYASNDGYIRYYTPTNFRNVLGLWWSGNDGSGSGLDADLLDGYHLTGGSASIGEKVFNNQGRNHSTQTNFNDTSLRAGVNYLQGGTNGPTGSSSHQWYGFRLGLGNDYGTQTGQSGHYASELYWARAGQGGSQYLFARDMESGSWGSWRKLYAGYADSAGSATNADTVDSLHASSFLRSDTTNNLYRVTAGDGNRIRFWDSDSYSIWMSSSGNGTWGGRLDSTSDYNMYFRMSGGTNRGFVFQNSTNEVFQIESNGKLRLGTNNTSNYIDASGGTYILMGSQYGYGYMTPGNSSWCHFSTDRASFYFGSPVSFDFGISDYSGNWTLNDSGLYFDGNTSRRIQGETLNSNNSVSIYGNWDRFDCMGRVLDWNTSNLHFGDGYNGVNHSSVYFQIGAIDYFRVKGDIFADGNVIAYYSDARLKQKVETIPNALEIIKGIRGVTFEWNKKSEEVWSKKEGDKDFGLISQEVEAVFPMGVAVQAGSDRNIERGFGDPDSPNYDPLHNNPNDEYQYKTVKYDKIVAIAIQAIKEQQEVIEKMQSKINELENKLNGN